MATIPGKTWKPGKAWNWAKMPGKPGKWHFFPGKQRVKPGKTWKITIIPDIVLYIDVIVVCNVEHNFHEYNL